MIEIMKKTLLTICVLLLASWNAAVAQVNPAKVSKIGDRAALTLSAEFNQLQVKDKDVKADADAEYEEYAYGTYTHGASESLYSEAFSHEFPNMLGKYVPSKTYETVLYRNSKNPELYKISPWVNGNELFFEVMANGDIIIQESPTGFTGQAGKIYAADLYNYCGEYPSLFNKEDKVIDLYFGLLDTQYIYGMDHDRFAITDYAGRSSGSRSGNCGIDGGDDVHWLLQKQPKGYYSLKISGSGEMESYLNDNGKPVARPWQDPFNPNYDLQNIYKIVIVEGVKDVGEGAFAAHGGVETIELPNSVTRIGRYSFEGCSGLSSIKIPNSVTSIGDYAFRNCSGLTILEIPSSVMSIGEGTFRGCTNQTNIVVAADNPVYDSRGNCNAIIETASNTLIAGCSKTFIPNSVESIGSYAFYGCSGLTNLEIPNSVESIGSYAFVKCSGLTNLVISNNVNSIEDYTFYGCSSLTNLEIPNSVMYIGKEAFMNCSGLTNLVISNNVYSIEDYAFYGCNSLKTIFIPNTVESIGIGAFAYCSELESVVIGHSVTSLEEYGFWGCDKLETIKMLGEVPPTAFDNTFLNYDATLYVPIGAYYAYRSADVWKNFSLIEEFDATGIENVETIVGKNISVYTTNGKLVQQIPNYNGAPLRLPKGVYVVRAGKETKKVLVK